ncbi:hypothetical protein KEH51_00145 [[Brevibacterium] frigoritolerans]|uniref:LysR substrate-binding domain-containing protein n=1 Tax=Peribacillus frigoritolerans TaxID=450367 RepID=A0A941J1T3_9BACI|nr:hypothetical protein [Peribacillus frigoritolerans]
MLIDLRQTKEYLLSMGSETKGSLKLGISSHFGLYNLPSILEEYMVNCPEVHLNVDTGFSTEMMELLMQGEIDVAIVKAIMSGSMKSFFLRKKIYASFQKMRYLLIAFRIIR